jgi:hypothetical protein
VKGPIEDPVLAFQEYALGETEFPEKGEMGP